MLPDVLRVVDELLRQLAHGELTAGDPIPAVVQLAADHNVPIVAADGACLRLIVEGVLVLRPGIGTVVATPSVDDEYTDEQLAKDRAWLDRAIAFLRDALENPDTSVRWDPRSSSIGDRSTGS